MAIVLALFTGIALGQVNVAPLVEYGAQPGVGFDGQGRFGFAVGNVQLLDLGVDGTLHASRPFADDKQPPTKGSWFRDRFVTYGTFSRRTVGGGADRTVIANSGIAHLRYTRMFWPRFGMEAFGQAGNDAILELDLRVVGGAGLRVAFENPIGRLWAGVGYLAEFEGFSDDIDRDQVLNHRVNTYVSAEIELVDDRLDLLTTTYFQPYYDDWRDVQFLEEGKLRIRVTEALAFGFEGRLRVDTRPPEGLKPVDLRLTNTIELHLSNRKAKPEAPGATPPPA